MERLTDKCWRNLDPWECCGQDRYCTRGCHDEGGCTKGCIVPTLYARLARYEDILFSEDGTELVSLEQLRKIVSQLPNPPLTLEELREMDGEPVWVTCFDSWRLCYGLSDYRGYLCMDTGNGSCILMKDYGEKWLAYRRKPEDGTK